MTVIEAACWVVGAILFIAITLPCWIMSTPRPVPRRVQPVRDKKCWADIIRTLLVNRPFDQLKDGAEVALVNAAEGIIDTIERTYEEWAMFVAPPWQLRRSLWDGSIA